MLRKALRLHHSTLLTPPLSRRRFQYGSVALYREPKGNASVIVSKKTLRSSVDRKRLQRRVRHAFQGIQDVHVAVAIYPNKEALSAPFADLKDALVQVLTAR